jgi:putative nucleotidyltransferase with HDIG domain
LRDKETEGHSQRVTELTVKIAEKMGMKGEKLKYVKWGALLHDIGKLGVPDSILHKPGPLTEEEWKIMKRHPELGYQMLSRIDFILPALEIPLYHHEKWDGSGYPKGLKGKEIPLPARIFAVVDVYDALTNDRPYRKAYRKEEAVEEILRQSGKHFDPEVVRVFVEWFV